MASAGLRLAVTALRPVRARARWSRRRREMPRDAQEMTPDIAGRRDAETIWSDWAEWLATRDLDMATFACASGHSRAGSRSSDGTHPGPLHAVVGPGPTPDTTPPRWRTASRSSARRRSARWRCGRLGDT